MEAVERDLILETLGHTLGNRTHAADHSRHLDPRAAEQAAGLCGARYSGNAGGGRIEFDYCGVEA